MPRSARPAPRARPALAAGFALALAACGGAPRPTTETTAPIVDPDAPPLPAAGAFYTEGLAEYAAATRLPPTADEEALALDLGRTLVPPPALDCLAREYAARFGADGRDPGPGTVQALAHHCGYWTRPVTPYSVTAPDRAKLAAHFRKLPPAALEGVVGLGVVGHPDGKVTATLLHDPGEVRIAAPVARATAAQVLRGKLLRGQGTLELWVDGRDGPQRIEIEVADTGAFEAPIPAAAVAVELARKQGRFRRTVALVRRKPRAASYPEPPPPLAGPLDRKVVADALTDAINAARSKANLEPMTHERRLDPPLDDWMSRIVAGTADDTPPGMLDDRGWPYTQLRYAISGGRTAAQAFELLAETPTGRRTVLTDDVDRVAVGLHPFADGSGFDVVFAAVQTFRPVPAAEARATLLADLNGDREDDGLTPLAPNPGLDALAQRLADDALAGKVQWAQVVPTAMEAARDERLARGAFAAGAFTTATLGAAPFDQEPSAMSGEVAHIGIGVAGGPLPDGGAPRHIVVYLVAAEVPETDI